MNILNKLTIRNLKLNIKRTIVTIIGIILSTALICAVAGMFTSLQETLIQDSIKSGGNKHIVIKDVEYDDLKYFINNRNIKSYYLNNNLGYAKLAYSENKYKPYLYLKSYTLDGFKKENYVIKEGRIPQDENEIVISETVNTDAFAKFKIGDKITLNVGTRVLENSPESILNQNNPISKDEPELIINTTEKTYEIVGFIENVGYALENVYVPGYIAITITNNFSNADKLDISLLFKNPKYYKDFKNLLDQEFPKYSYSFNNELLRWQMAKISDSALNSIIAIISVVIAIIIFTSIFVIRNSFNISITEKKRQYGMLASVGATKSQIKKNVLFEGFILGLIGIPLGIISGIFADFILVKVINILLKESLNDVVFMFKVPWLAIILSIILASITIYFSTISAALKSAKISPIEAIRSNDEIKVKKKKLKTPRIISKLFGLGGVIAYKNLKRNKSKYRTTVISLVVSISVFIALSTLITYGFKMTNMYYKDYNYNISVRRLSKNNESLEEINPENIIKEYLNVLKLGSVDSYSIHKELDLEISNKYLKESKSNKEYNVTLRVISLGNNEYEKFIKQIGGKVSDYENGGILIDENTYYDQTKKKYVFYNEYNLKENDIVKGINEENQSLEIKVLKRTNKRPMGCEGGGSYLIVSDDLLESLGHYEVKMLYINTTNSQEFVKNLDEYITNTESNLRYNDYDAIVREENSMIILIAIFLYGFIIVISLIGVTNIFNTITTNMNLRQKEFAMLKSIGMTKKEFNHMISLESIMYGFKSLVIGIPLGCLGSFGLYRGFEINSEMPFKLPWLAIILAIVIVILLISLIMHYSFMKINKQNIIETIRKENI